LYDFFYGCPILPKSAKDQPFLISNLSSGIVSGGNKLVNKTPIPLILKALKRKSNDWLAWIQDNVPERREVPTPGMLIGFRILFWVQTRIYESMNL
jgi:hypothetical protein